MSRYNVQRSEGWRLYRYAVVDDSRPSGRPVEYFLTRKGAERWIRRHTFHRLGD